MTELFESEESLSPMERWMRDHYVTVNKCTEKEEWIAGYRGFIRRGATRTEAVEKLAAELWQHKQIKHWAM